MNTEKESRSRVQLVPLGAELVITQLVCGCDWLKSSTFWLVALEFIFIFLNFLLVCGGDERCKSGTENIMP